MNKLNTLSNMNDINYWTNYCMELIRKEKIIKPTAMKKIIEMPEFISSGISENELSESVLDVFKKERESIMMDARKALSKLRK